MRETCCIQLNILLFRDCTVFIFVNTLSFLYESCDKLFAAIYNYKFCPELIYFWPHFSFLSLIDFKIVVKWQTIADSVSPVFEEPFRFKIHDPNIQELDIEVSFKLMLDGAIWE